MNYIVDAVLPPAEIITHAATVCFIQLIGKHWSVNRFVPFDRRVWCHCIILFYLYRFILYPAKWFEFDGRNFDEKFQRGLFCIHDFIFLSYTFLSFEKCLDPQFPYEWHVCFDVLFKFQMGIRVWFICEFFYLFIANKIFLREDKWWWFDDRIEFEILFCWNCN